VTTGGDAERAQPACYPDHVLELDQIAPDKLRPLRRVEYDRMVEMGLFEDERIELLHGVLVAMSPQGAPHADVIAQLNMLLTPALVGRAIVRVQSPLAVSDDSEPEPDLAVVALGDHRAAHPSTALLVVEVADSSLRKDREIKAALYAQAGVTEYWIADVPSRRLEVHRGPGALGYTQVATHESTDLIALAAFLR